MNREIAVTYECAGERLVGILNTGNTEAEVGVVIVVGGPQYRVGSHRQFVIMARSIAEAGYPVFRFDYRGMGDSEGASRSFDTVDEDIRRSVDRFCSELPTLRKVILLGLCDAASANLIYAVGDDRVRGLVLLNPWVRTVQGEARTYLKHYYLQRLLQNSFWRKVFSGEFSIGRSLRDFLSSVSKWRGSDQAVISANSESKGDFLARMLSGFERFRHPALIQISGRDLTSKEFVDLCHADNNWRCCVDRANVEIQKFPPADHTMSTRAHLDKAIAELIAWITASVRAI